MHRKIFVLLAILFVASLAFSDTLFFEDFEGDISGWTFDDLNWESDHYAGDSITTYWHISDFNAYSGNSFWCGDPDIGGYNNGWLQAMTTPPITLASGTSTLSFKHRYKLEDAESMEPMIHGTVLISVFQQMAAHLGQSSIRPSHIPM
jgi:hypothetical protein